MSWERITELESALNDAREKERKAFERYMAAYEIRHQAHKENQPLAVIAFVNRMEERANEAYQESKADSDTAFTAFEAACQPPQPQPVMAVEPRRTRTTKTEQLQAALDEASKTCIPLQGATVKYRNGQGFYIWHGGKVLGFVNNFKRGMYLVAEWKKTGRINYAELRAR